MMRKTMWIISLFLLVSACGTAGPKDETQLVDLSVEEENQLLEELGVVGYSGAIVYVHGCQSRSAGLVFQRKDVVRLAQQYKAANFSRRIKEICSFSK